VSQLDPGEVRIRNQRYQPWPEIMLGMFVVVCMAAMCGLFLVRRIAMFDCVFAWVIVASLALFLFEWLLPRLGSVRQLKLGIGIETAPLVWRHPAQAVNRITFAADPAEDYVERDSPTRLFEATIEVQLEKPFRMIVDEADAERLRLWAIARGIVVRDRRVDLSRTGELAGGA
jgi:hypothetical protein